MSVLIRFNNGDYIGRTFCLKWNSQETAWAADLQITVECSSKPLINRYRVSYYKKYKYEHVYKSAVYTGRK